MKEEAGGGHWKVPNGKLARSPLGFRPMPSHLTVRWGWAGRVLESFCEYRALSIITNSGPWAHCLYASVFSVVNME